MKHFVNYQYNVKIFRYRKNTSVVIFIFHITAKVNQIFTQTAQINMAAIALFIYY